MPYHSYITNNTNSTSNTYNYNTKAKIFRLFPKKNNFNNFVRNLDSIAVNNKNLEVIPTAKLLCLTISSKLKWNAHVSEIVRKGASRSVFVAAI